MLIGVIIQARMGSTRLPGKVLMDICGEPMLSRVIQRVRHSKQINKIIVATTIDERDDAVVHLAQINGVETFRGSERDVLNRYYLAAKKIGLDIIVRVTADCPLIDAALLDEVVSKFIETDCDIATNAGTDTQNRTYPRGLDIEVFSFGQLERANEEALESFQREHVTPYLYNDANRVKLIKDKVDNSSFRWTVDTVEDITLVREIYSGLGIGRDYISFREILCFLKKNPTLKYINSNIIQKNYRDSEN